MRERNFYTLAVIYFFTAHPNPASHFVEYAQVYEERGISYQVIAGENVSDKFADLKSQVVVIDPEDEERLTKIVQEMHPQSTVITDIANERWVTLHDMLPKKYPSIKRAVYYDNPERYVPGGYSELAAKVIEKAQIILFANSSLVKKGIESEEGVSIDLSEKRTVGIGYYPKADALKILDIRKNQNRIDEIRSSLLEKNEIPNNNQKIIVYIGGANDVYYNKAFPHFLSLISEMAKSSDSPLKDTLLVLQQHPRAKSEGNLDAKRVKDLMSSQQLPEGFNFVVSDLPIIDALAIADGVFYYQTSMAAQFVFAEIPIISQVGHEPYCDLLVRAGFPSVTNVDQLSQVLSTKASSGNLKVLEKELGMDPNWKENLLQIAD